MNENIQGFIAPSKENLIICFQLWVAAEPTPYKFIKAKTLPPNCRKNWSDYRQVMKKMEDLLVQFEVSLDQDALLMGKIALDLLLEYLKDVIPINSRKESYCYRTMIKYIRSKRNADGNRAAEAVAVLSNSMQLED
jgi:hypothetical protein